MDSGKKLRSRQEKRIIIHQDDILFSGDFLKQRVNFLADSLAGARAEREGDDLRDGRDEAKKYLHFSAPAVTEFMEDTDNRFHMAGKILSGREIAVHPHIICPELKQDKIRPRLGQDRFFLLKKAKVFSGVIPFAPVI